MRKTEDVDDYPRYEAGRPVGEIARDQQAMVCAKIALVGSGGERQHWL